MRTYGVKKSDSVAEMNCLRPGHPTQHTTGLLLLRELQKCHSAIRYVFEIWSYILNGISGYFLKVRRNFESPLNIPVVKGGLSVIKINNVNDGTLSCQLSIG